MTKGYLVMAQGNFAKQAEALALSIKKTQSTINSISVITDSEIDCSLFDNVIPLPSIDLSRDSEWKIHNRVFFYDLTPYDETVILDADMLFLTDVSHWWDSFTHYDLLVTDKVKTFRGDWVENSPYRQAFVANKYADLYSAFSYFKKSETAETFFNLMKTIVADWDTWTAKFATDYRPSHPSIDVAMGMAAKIMGIEDEITSSLDYPTFTHMKGGCQGWRRKTEEWDDLLGVYVSGNKLRLGPYQQTGILHYVKKSFVDDEILEMFK